jgi:hypothetical protein
VVTPGLSDLSATYRFDLVLKAFSKHFVRRVSCPLHIYCACFGLGGASIFTFVQAARITKQVGKASGRQLPAHFQDRVEKKLKLKQTRKGGKKKK